MFQRDTTGPPAAARWPAGVRQWVRRWSGRRHAFAQLCAQHEGAGYRLSPASWQRLKEDTGRHTTLRALPGR